VEQFFPYQECNKQINAGAGVQRTHKLIWNLQSYGELCIDPCNL